MKKKSRMDLVGISKESQVWMLSSNWEAIRQWPDDIFMHWYLVFRSIRRLRHLCLALGKLCACVRVCVCLHVQLSLTFTGCVHCLKEAGRRRRGSLFVCRHLCVCTGVARALCRSENLYIENFVSCEYSREKHLAAMKLSALWLFKEGNLTPFSLHLNQSVACFEHGEHREW